MNTLIERGRKAALHLLNASKQEIEHGLELHANSIVVDSYGFGAYAALDSAAMSRKLQDGASRRELSDMEEEMLFTRFLHNTSQREKIVTAWKAAGVTCVIKNSGEENNSVPILLKRLAYNIHVTDAMKDTFRKVTCAADIRQAKADGQHGYCLTTNGVPLAERWNSVEEELGYVGLFGHLGVRMMHLTYNRRNLLGDGCAESTDAGLSDFGRAAIAELNRQNILPDVAHSGLTTSLEIAKVSSKPVVASHTACLAIHSHCRNKSDNVIRAIAETGGFIGVCCIPAFLGGTGDIRMMLDHIDHISKTVGIEHVAIGTDQLFRVPPENLTEELQFAPQRKSFENFWPSNDPLFTDKWNQPEQLESMMWTNWPLFTVGLVQRGYSDDNIRKIIGGNVLRVLGE